MKDLMKGDAEQLDEILRLAAEDKETADEALKEKLARRKAA